MKRLFFALVLLVSAQAYTVRAEEAADVEDSSAECTTSECSYEVTALDDGALVIKRSYRNSNKKVLLDLELFDELAEKQAVVVLHKEEAEEVAA